MNDDSPVQKPDEPESESRKKTTRIFLADTMKAKPAPGKTTTFVGLTGEKKATGPIVGIPVHSAPIPQTIKLKRPSTSPIVISPPDITTVPTVVKKAHPRTPPTSAVGETATVIREPVQQRPQETTSRIILDLAPQPTDLRPKTTPISGEAPAEPTPGPKTIRLKRPSTVIAPGQPEEKEALPFEEPTARKSETAKIELPRELEYQIPATQRKTIKIKRTDRNIIPRTVTIARRAEAAPQVEAAVLKEEPSPRAPVQEEPLRVFSVAEGLAVLCLALLLYLLAAQALGPDLILPLPSALF